MTVLVLSRRLALRKSTAYRFVSGLRNRGFLDDLGDGRYRLGPRILQLAEAARQQLSVVEPGGGIWGLSVVGPCVTSGSRSWCVPWSPRLGR